MRTVIANPTADDPRRGGRGAAIRRLLPAVLIAPLLLAHPPAEAAELRLAEVSDRMTQPAPHYPVPGDPGMVFFLQRSANPNTVVYAARFDAGGTLARDPLSAFWRRYNARGEVKDLSMLERRLAYGVRTDRRPDGSFDVRFRAIPEISFTLEQRGPGDAVLTFAPQGESIELTHGYVALDEGGLAPEVSELRLFGKRRADGRPVQVVYGVSGGTVPG